jgi:WD40 repeat protein
MKEAPLQIYCSALVFAPEMSIVRGHFKNQIPHWIRGLPKVQRDWSSLEQTLEGHSDSVMSVAFSPDGSKVASGSYDRTVRVWNVVTGQAEQTLEGHWRSVTSVAFSPDGSKVASGSRDDTVRVWNVATGQAEQTLGTGWRSVSSVAFSPDGSKVMSESDNCRAVQEWDVVTRQAEQTLEGSASSVAFSPDGNKSHSFYSIDSSRLWVTQNGMRILYLPFNFRPSHFATKDGILAIGTSTGQVAIIIFRSDVKGQTI